ncbi:hypothetical protein [Collinsella intestinalis]|uniref:hypothetical protein n=1 Tax=Collinsella intestinalis TaxID=147207 RepID=UPI0025A3EE1E|nr:hypothetical protein [Collinsella intestinalis]MDM8162429.1 hypothetical protein [Collinsella intestinalis]
MRVEHYATGAMETVEKQEMVEAFLELRLSAMCIHYLLTALKYFDRMGLKDKAESDAYKCADYLCRAVTGEWLEVEDGR